MVPAATEAESQADGNRRTIVIGCGIARRIIAIDRRGRRGRRGIYAAAQSGKRRREDSPTENSTHLLTSSGSRMVTPVIRLSGSFHPRR